MAEGRRSIASLAALVALALLVSPAAAADNSSFGLIQTSGNVFVDTSCNSQYIASGWNGWQTLLYASNQMAPSGFSSGRDYVSYMLSQAKTIGFNTYRVFIQGDDTYLLKSDGTYDENIFQGLDWLLVEAQKNDVRLLLVLNNLWKDDGVPLFEDLCGSASSNFKPDPSNDPRPETTLNVSERQQTPYLWYTDATCKAQYKAYVDTVATRVNTVSGVAYLDDPTIFAWGLLNEPRCKYCGGTPVADWYDEIATHLKKTDPQHMITTGEEGFFGSGNAYSSYDPDDSNHWALESGQHFVDDHSSDAIDFAATHMWLSNWAVPDSEALSFSTEWLDSHGRAAADLGKPLLMEEFGAGISDPSLIPSIRDPWFQLVFSAVDSSSAQQGNLEGALIWLWAAHNERTSDTDILTSDSTITNIAQPFSTAWTSRSVCGVISAASGNRTGDVADAPAPAPDADAPAPVPDAGAPAPAPKAGAPAPAPKAGSPVPTRSAGVPPPPPTPSAVSRLLGRRLLDQA